MIIDERIIQDGISVTLIAKLIERHAYEHERFSKLRRYYDGAHDILQRKQTSKGLANNRIVCNHAKYIVDMTSSYLAGNPITYAAAEGYDIEAVKNAYLVEDVSRLDFEIARTMCIYGRAYELVFTDDASAPKSAIISPEQAFVVYNDDCTHIPLFGVYYYVTRDIDGNVTGGSVQCLHGL